jgi:hypothetical protein
VKISVTKGSGEDELLSEALRNASRITIGSRGRELTLEVDREGSRGVLVRSSDAFYSLKPAADRKGLSVVQMKPECNACGSSDYDGDLRECPHCGSTKCSRCDMGDDVECAACPDEETDE